MAIVKCNPTSPGRRFVVKVVNSDLHKGAPYAPLVEKQGKTGGRNNNGPHVIVGAGISNTTVWSIFVATRMAFQPPLSASNMIRTVPLTSRC